MFFTVKILIWSIMGKLEGEWSSDITKEKGKKFIILEENRWLDRLLNRIGVLLLLTLSSSWRGNNLVKDSTAHLL